MKKYWFYLVILLLMANVNIVKSQDISASSSGGGTANLVVGTSTITGGTNGYVLYDNSGVLGEKQPTGTGLAVLQTTPTLITPVLGVATSTSVAIGGCTIGSNAFCATGTSLFNNSLQLDVAATVKWGTTSSFPQLARSGNSLSAQLADGSDTTGMGAAAFTTTGGGLASNGIQRGIGLQLGSTNLVNWSSTTAYNGTVDTTLSRNAAGVVQVGTTAANSLGSILATNYLQVTTTVGSLGSATVKGQRKFVTDALTPVFGSTVTAGGAVAVPVYSDGTNWIVG